METESRHSVEPEESNRSTNGESQRLAHLTSKKDDDTKTRLGVSASMNEQRRGDESLRTFNAGFNGSGTQETIGDVTTQTSGGLTRDKNGSSMRSKVRWGSNVKMRWSKVEWKCHWASG